MGVRVILCVIEETLGRIQISALKLYPSSKRWKLAPDRN